MKEIQPEPMSESVEQYEIELSQKRDRLARSISSLKERVTAVSDWRSQVKEHPQAALLIAFAAGWLLSVWLSPRRPS
jgi:ElaB/YqjD/DUF883 family membrane-anchored ribosome-binding protein